MQSLRDLWMDGFHRYLIIFLVLIAIVLLVMDESPTSSIQEDATMHFFYLDTCPHCHEQIAFHASLREEFPDLVIQEYELTDPWNVQIYVQMLTERGQPPQGIRTPTTVIGDQVIIGFDDPQGVGEVIRSALREEGLDQEDSIKVIEFSVLGKEFSIDPGSYSLPVLAVLLGLVDGFNPCAMWVLVYLISLLVSVKSKRRGWLIIGVFLAASGILYFLFMTLWLNIFLLVGILRPVQILIGLFALGVGVSNLRTYYTTKGELVCEVGDLESKQKTMRRARDIINAPLTWAALLGIIVLAFAVNSIEFMCSFGIPAVFTEILAVADISSAAHYGLIALYVLMYMIDDLIIFALAYFAIQSSAGQRYAKFCKLVAGVLLVLLGVLLIVFPGLLTSLG